MATKRRFTRSADGIERCSVVVTVRLRREEVVHFENLAECEGVSFTEAVARSAASGIRDAQPLEAYGYTS